MGNIWEVISNDPGVTNATIVSAVDAGKIILSAAPLVKVLKTFDTNDTIEYRGPLRYFSVGQYHYRAENFQIKNVLNLLAKKSTKLKQLNFETPPEANLVKQLFERNKIAKVYFKDKSEYGWYRDIPSDKIKELDVTFENNNAELVSLKQVSVYYGQCRKPGIVDNAWASPCRRLDNKHCPGNDG